MVAIVFLIAIIELIWYFDISRTDIEGFVPSEDIFVTTTIINEAVINYTEDHNGTVPDSLVELAGAYLPKGRIWERSLLNSYYTKITPCRYELVPTVKNSDTLPNFIFTNEGVNLVGTE